MPGPPRQLGITDVPVGVGPNKVVGTNDLAQPAGPVSPGLGFSGADIVGFDDTRTAPPIGANTVQEAIDILKGGGGGSNVAILRVPFTFASGTVALYPLIPGRIVSTCCVRITTPWLVAATVTVGTPSSPTALLAVPDVLTQITGRYDSQFDFQATVAENLQLILGGPVGAVGAGYVLFTVG